MPTENFWFGFRQTHPGPPSQAIACGPYASYDEAKRERESAKKWDCDVSIPFAASTKAEAEAKARRMMEPPPLT